MPNAIPFKAWLYASDLEINNPSRVLYQEAGLWDFDEWKSKVEAYQEGIHDVPSCKTKAEVSIQALWALINIFTFHIKHPKVLTTDLFDPATLVAEIHRIRKAMEKLRMPGGTGLKPEDEPTMFHENMLMSCYTKLEALRAIAKLVGFIRDISGAKVTHPLKKKIPAGYPDELWNETLVCFEALRDVARSYLTLLAARGVVAIRAQVRWGETGSVLRALLSDEDVEFYAKGYVESAVEAWNGVLRVKL
jgi:N-terminal acetyltransferase B complex non-catalytic subunit